MRVRARAALAAAVVVAAAVAPTAYAGTPAAGPSVVVAVADTGVNPYHSVFYRPQNTRHPCTWVEGFTDCSIPALPLSVGQHKDYAKAVEADREIWDSVEPHQWYWIPRTNIIGAVCDTARGGSAASLAVPDATCILDDDGHGTGTASSVLTEAPGALLLVHDGKSSATDLATAPVVPDVQSHSWGPAAPLPLQAVDVAAGTELCDGGTRRPESLYFLAAGNEAPWPTIADCDRYRLDVHVVGGGYPGYWDYDSWSVYDFASWMCRPVAMHTSLEDWTKRSCGTSFAAPTAAGAAAAALLRVREHDGWTGRSTTARVSASVTRAAFEDALRNAASYTPEAKYERPGVTECTYVLCYVGWAPLPEQAPYLFWGYGWLDSTVTDAVVSCALRRGCPEKPAEAQQWNAQRTAVRGAFAQRLHPPVTQQDAGTDRDAGSDRRGAIPVVPGRDYAARLDAYGRSGDPADAYAVRARAGQRITISSAAAVGDLDASAVAGCWQLLTPSGERLDELSRSGHVYGHCSATTADAPPEDVEVPVTGAYLLVYGTRDGTPPHDYRFAVTVGR